jgi:hypothetical protein
MLGLEESAADASSKKIKKIASALIFCLDELGVWPGLKVLISLCVLCFWLCSIFNAFCMANIIDCAFV